VTVVSAIVRAPAPKKPADNPFVLPVAAIRTAIEGVTPMPSDSAITVPGRKKRNRKWRQRRP